MIKKKVLPIFISTIWISVSEFTRNEILFKTYWTSHYENLGMIFPSEPLNGAVWGIWALVFSVVIFTISKKFSLIQSFLLAWTIGFLMMWIVIGNLGVLPFSLLIYAIPLSILEVFLSCLIMHKLK